MIPILTLLLAGHAVVAGLYWAFLNVPESNVWMLALSALLVILMAAVSGWTEAAAVLAWTSEEPRRRIARRALGGPAWILASLAVYALFWWITDRAASWHATYKGQIDAVLMARLGVTRTGVLHQAIGWILWAVRWVIGVSLGLGLFASGTMLGVRGLLVRVWFTRALALRRLLVIGLALGVLVMLPWRWSGWRPRALPPTWMEPAFVAVKLGVLLLVAHIAWAIILREAARGQSPLR